MFLVKFIDPEWRDQAVLGTSIRIGSVFLYRAIEDARIRDETEGGGRIVWKSSAPLDAETHNRIFVDEGFGLADGYSIHMNGVPLISERSRFNAFVFSCCVLSKKADIASHARLFGRASWYYIKNIWKFADKVAAAIRDELIRRVEETPGSASFPHSLIQNLHVYPVIGKVAYTDTSKDQIVHEHNAATFDPRKVQLNPFFHKPVRFSSEREFRFVWILNLGDGLNRNEWDLVSHQGTYLDLTIPMGSLSKRPINLSRGEIRDRAGHILV